MYLKNSICKYHNHNKSFIQVDEAKANAWMLKTLDLSTALIAFFHRWIVASMFFG